MAIRRIAADDAAAFGERALDRGCAAGELRVGDVVDREAAARTHAKRAAVFGVQHEAALEAGELQHDVERLRNQRADAEARHELLRKRARCRAARRALGDGGFSAAASSSISNQQ